MARRATTPSTCSQKFRRQRSCTRVSGSILSPFLRQWCLRWRPSAARERSSWITWSVLLKPVSADVVIIDLDEDNLVPLYDPVSHLAYAVEAADVRTVIVDGRIVLRDGVLTTADEREIRSQVRGARHGHRLLSCGSDS